MDPNENLREQRAILERWRNDASWTHDLERLAQLAEALDQWLSKGGFLPEQWQRPVDAIGSKIKVT